MSGVDLESRPPGRDSGSDPLPVRESASGASKWVMESVGGDNPWPESAPLRLSMVGDWVEV